MSPFAATTVSVPVNEYGITGGKPSGVNDSTPVAVTAPRCDICPEEEKVVGAGLVEISTDAVPVLVPLSGRFVPPAAASAADGVARAAPSTKLENNERLRDDMVSHLPVSWRPSLTDKTAPPV
jgi:hypothetical protein